MAACTPGSVNLHEQTKQPSLAQKETATAIQPQYIDYATGKKQKRAKTPHTNPPIIGKW
jgi:hypothetical protein